MKLILTACIVNFGFTFVRLDLQTGNKFQNLFDSIARKDNREAKLHRETLIDDIAKEQQAFDAMKDEIRIAHSGSKRNFYKKDYVNETGKANKRQAYERGPGCEDCPPAGTKSAVVSCEMDHDSLVAGKYSLSECTVFYCHHETGISEPVLYKIPCQDYVAKVFPEKLPQQGRELFESLCRMCGQETMQNETAHR